MLRPPTHFVCGATTWRREMLHGLPWMEQPMTVVEDSGTWLAVLLKPGYLPGSHHIAPAPSPTPARDFWELAVAWHTGVN